MSVETLKMISLIAYVISGVFLLITIWIFVKFNVAEIIGEITGVTRRKAIKDIRNQSSEEKSGFYNPSYASGKGTDRTARDRSGKLSGRMGKAKGASENLDKPTSVLDDNENGKTTVLTIDSRQEGIRLPAQVTVITEIILCDTEEVIA
jgi:hypothetical protein